MTARRREPGRPAVRRRPESSTPPPTPPGEPPMRKRLALASATAFALLTMGACSSQPDAATPDAHGAQPNLELVSALTRYDSCDSVLQTIRSEAGKRITAYGLTGYAGSGGSFTATGGAVSDGGPPV